MNTATVAWCYLLKDILHAKRHNQLLDNLKLLHQHVTSRDFLPLTHGMLLHPLPSHPLTFLSTSLNSLTNSLRVKQ